MLEIGYFCRNSFTHWNLINKILASFLHVCINFWNLILKMITCRSSSCTEIIFWGDFGTEILTKFFRISYLTGTIAFVRHATIIESKIVLQNLILAHLNLKLLIELLHIALVSTDFVWVVIAYLLKIIEFFLVWTFWLFTFLKLFL